MLKSLKDSQLYIAFTSDLKKRIKEHNSGMVKSTKPRTPFMLYIFKLILQKKKQKRGNTT